MQGHATAQLQLSNQSPSMCHVGVPVIVISSRGRAMPLEGSLSTGRPVEDRRLDGAVQGLAPFGPPLEEPGRDLAARDLRWSGLGAPLRLEDRIEVRILPFALPPDVVAEAALPWPPAIPNRRCQQS